ncbi:portal protein, partial [Herbiconiux daphne]
GQILEINTISKIPFSTFTPFSIPGSVWGQSIYDKVKDLQDLGSTVLRAVIDNALNANFRRYIAVKGQYDRQSLLQNRPGAVIEQMAQGSVDVFPYHPLPQGLDNLLEYVNSEKEERTGISKVGQGLDASVFKNDNSTATTQMVMTAALNRVRMVARNMAQGGMADMMLAIYDLVRQNAKEPITVETSQGVLQIDPKQLPERTKMIVNTAIGAAEKAERAQKLQVALMAFTQIPQMNAFLQAQGAY